MPSSSFGEEDLWNFSQSEHIIGPGSHIEYPTGTKNSNLVEDHPRNIPAKFGSNRPSGFGEEAWNVKSLHTTDDGRQVMVIVHLDQSELKSNTCDILLIMFYLNDHVSYSLLCFTYMTMWAILTYFLPRWPCELLFIMFYLYDHVCYFLVHFGPGELLPSLGVRRLSYVNFSHFKLLWTFMYSLALIIFVVSEKMAFEHFPIGSNVNLCPAMAAILDFRSA
jgi:hypothetical protein